MSDEVPVIELSDEYLERIDRRKYRQTIEKMIQLNKEKAEEAASVEDMDPEDLEGWLRWVVIWEKARERLDRFEASRKSTVSEED